MNTFGSLLRVHLFGQSHGPGLGCVLDGVPPGTPLDAAVIQRDLDRRRPGTGAGVSARDEADVVHVLSGVHDGKATGDPLLLWIGNHDARPQDYDALRDVARPGHGDWPEHVATAGHRDPRGGGHRSGRITAALVAAGAVARLVLEPRGIHVGAAVDQVGPHHAPAPELPAEAWDARIDATPLMTLGPRLEWEEEVAAARRARDSVGGGVAFRVDGVPAGWGRPWADALDARLAHALMAIPGAKAVALGAGWDAAAARGSAFHDALRVEAGAVLPAGHNAGGILGGRSAGGPITGRVAFKPTPSIAQAQATVTMQGHETTVEVTGRHDACIAVRAAPVVAAAVRLVVADAALAAGGLPP